MRRRSIRTVLVAVFALAALLGFTSTASANTTTTFTPSPFPWEAPIQLEVNGYSGAISVLQGPYVSKLGIRVAPPTTDPIYSESFRLLNYATHTEIHWRNTTTGASGTAFSDETGRTPSATALIDTGVGSVDYTVVISTGALIPQLNPQTVSISGNTAVVPYNP